MIPSKSFWAIAAFFHSPHHEAFLTDSVGCGATGNNVDVGIGNTGFSGQASEKQS